jgi:hypothetical protein
MRQAADALSAPGAAPALARGPARTVRRDEETTGR